MNSNSTAPPAPAEPPNAEKTASAQSSPLPPTTTPPPTRHPFRRWAIIVFALAGLGIALLLGIPIASTALNTISTDDAYVNAYVTFVAPRVSGQVLEIYTDDNKRVEKGQLLVELDPVPYQAIVNIKQANLDSAKADERAAESQVRALFAQARSQRWKLQASMESVDNQVALLSARVATLRSKEATLVRVKEDLRRIEGGFKKNANSQQELDLAVESVKVAEALKNQAIQEVYEVRVTLGQPPVPKSGDLTEMPANLNQTFSSVRQALADLVQTVAQLGVKMASSEATPKEALDYFRSQDPEGNIDRIVDKLTPLAPAVIQAVAKRKQAERDLEQALLNLSYCKVYAEISGVVTRRNVYPGNNVQAAQQIMAIRSLKRIWIDANYKETQLASLKIGQRVEVISDTYGERRKFNGRITGFTYGTGSTLALLPPQNATGNFVKVVQRLPVRIELDDYDPEEDTLFAGLSVTPYVYYKEPPTGPNAGKKLQELSRAISSGGEVK